LLDPDSIIRGRTLRFSGGPRSGPAAASGRWTESACQRI